MIAQSLKEKLKKRIPNVGSWLQIPDPIVTEIMVQAGFDWLVVDLEHSIISLSQAQAMFQIIEANAGIPLVRLSSNDAVQIKRVLDAGARGIIVPNLNSVSDAKRALAAAKYPPSGTRGTGIGRAQKYGADFKEYFNRANKDIIVIGQIEHKNRC